MGMGMRFVVGLGTVWVRCGRECGYNTCVGVGVDWVGWFCGLVAKQQRPPDALHGGSASRTANGVFGGVSGCEGCRGFFCAFGTW